MIDLAVLRDSPEALRDALRRRHNVIDVDELTDLDERRRTVRSEAERARAEQKLAGKEISGLEGDARRKAIADAGQLADTYKRLLAEADELDEKFQKLWINVPNMAHPSAPDGTTEGDAVEIRRWGTPAEFGFEVRDHQDLGESLGIIDIERAVRLSGSRFAYLKGKAALLELGLVRFALDRLTARGFTPVIPPVLVREEALFGTGFFPTEREQVYAIESDELFLVGTSEVSLAALHLDEILEADELPIRYAGSSSCFRREAGTYGKDTRGIFRMHQFNKVEMFSFCHPEQSWEEHEYMLSIEEQVCQELELPYRVVNVAVGDLGAPAAKKYDIEVWIPSQETFREITSCSNTTDYQARRLRARFRDGTGNRLLHTLNGTVVTSSRTMLAIIENHQQGDGSVKIPGALQPYVGFDVIAP
ncbi:MAG: serine--tRNA ligase [Acidimicrobiia bacterium]|nr:serine--tRNA ligase [Acidimicrobiia bacterium]MDH3398459.1 serine--tRNA ligase [Acidimicrobiia bacterium]